MESLVSRWETVLSHVEDLTIRDVFGLLSEETHLILEALAICVIVYLLLRPAKSRKSHEDILTEKEIDELVNEWSPEPLVPALTEEQEVLLQGSVVVDSPLDVNVQVNGVETLNMSSMNFLGLASNPVVKEKVTAALNKYGVGSCGPRGFYGTIDVHLDLEEDLTKFMKTEEAIVYSDAMSTVSSSIPAFSKLGDLIVCDDGCNYAIQTGLKLSKSTVKYFKHNDLNDLQAVLESIRQEDIRKPPKPLNRRLIVVEGLYQNSGDICPLPQIIELKKKYKFRLMVDDSFGIGVLGATGRGTVEYFGSDVKDVDILTGSISTSLASTGGFCVGSHNVVDHQRLNGSGYCFSASSPPFLSVAASTSLKLLQDDPSVLVTLNKRAKKLRELLKDVSSHMLVCGHEDSPMVFLKLRADKSSGSRVGDLKLITKIHQKLLKDEQVLVSRVAPIANDRLNFPPALRLSVTAAHSEADLKKAAKAVIQVVKQVLKA